MFHIECLPITVLCCVYFKVSQEHNGAMWMVKVMLSDDRVTLEDKI